MKSLLTRLWKEEEGQDITEYALLLVMVSFVAIAAVARFGTAVNTLFTSASTSVATASGT